MNTLLQSFILVLLIFLVVFFFFWYVEHTQPEPNHPISIPAVEISKEDSLPPLPYKKTKTELQELVKSTLKKHGLNEKEIVIAFDIIQCESGWRPEAHRTSIASEKHGDWGLWQINYKVHAKSLTIAQMKDPVYSTEYAIALYKKYGWHPWTCHKLVRN